MLKTLSSKAFYAIGGGVAVFLAFGLYEAILAPPKIISFSIAPTIKWAQDFTTSTGIPVLNVVVSHRNRSHGDRFAVVGKDRPDEWFAGLGYDVLGTDVVPDWEVSHSGVFFGRGEMVKATTLKNADSPLEFFFYLPDTGILISPTAGDAD